MVDAVLELDANTAWERKRISQEVCGLLPPLRPHSHAYFLIRRVGAVPNPNPSADYIFYLLVLDLQTQGFLYSTTCYVLVASRSKADPDEARRGGVLVARRYLENNCQTNITTLTERKPRRLQRAANGGDSRASAALLMR